jgi:squalene cyclase
LEEAASTHIEMKTCFGCHNQGPPLDALRLAESIKKSPAAGFWTAQRDHMTDFVSTNRKRFQEGQGTGGGVDTAGTLLLALEAAQHKPDENTRAVVEYLLKVQPKNDFWKCSSNRPPTEASSFTTTYLALRALKRWPTQDQRERAETRSSAARRWLLKTPPQDTEDAVFRLKALRVLQDKDDREVLEAGVKKLIQAQRADGGWGQKPEMASDAYATGTVLVELLEAGVPKNSWVIRRGVQYLLAHQLSDGSWKVISRSKPFQPYYESGFPHEKNQFISASASGWATVALLMALAE